MRHILRLSGRRHFAAEFDGEEAETTAWVAEVVSNGGTVSDPRKAIVNTLIASLKADGIWTKLDRLWLFAAENQPSALTDMVGLDLGTVVNSPTFTTDVGYTFDGSTQNFDSGFNPGTAGGNYVQNSASASVWIVTPTADAEAYFGATGGSQAHFMELRATGVFFMNSNEAAGWTPGGDFVTLTRTASNLSKVYGNGAEVGTSAFLSDGQIDDGEILFAARYFGGPNLRADCQLACASIGGALTAGEAGDFYTHIQTYMTAVGL